MSVIKDAELTEEELRKESTYTVQWECTPMLDRPTFINGYITGAMPKILRFGSCPDELERFFIFG